jgi:hypothetical protein
MLSSRWFALVILCAASLMIILDGTPSRSAAHSASRRGRQSRPFPASRTGGSARVVTIPRLPALDIREGFGLPCAAARAWDLSAGAKR